MLLAAQSEVTSWPDAIVLIILILAVATVAIFFIRS